MNNFIREPTEQVPMPPVPHDDDSLDMFIGWLLKPPGYRHYDLISRNPEPKDFGEWTTKPWPFMEFCSKLCKRTPRIFEKTISEFFGILGGQVSLSNRGADDAIDAFWSTRSGNYIIQCKRWGRDRKVGTPVVREVFGALSDFRVTRSLKGAFIITTSDFPSNAIIFASDLQPPVGLINGMELFHLMYKIAPDMVKRIQEE